MGKTLRKFIGAAVLILGCTGSANAGYVFVGDWELGEGITWSTGAAPTLSGQEAAALLFGGNPDDYVISTIDSNPANIDFMAWIDRIFVGVTKAAQDFVGDDGDGLYNTAGDTSAYVHDNDPGCLNRYNNPAAPCDFNPNHNFAFLVVPEPMSIALLGLGLAGLGFSRRRPLA